MRDIKGARLRTTGDIERFITGGKATFTVLSPATGDRYTFRVNQKENDDGSLSPFFVSVLNGPDNYTNYQYIGIISAGGRFRTTAKSKVSPDALSVRCINWLLENVHSEEQMDRIEFWHCGKCGMCGRKLTVPESIESGIGPICARR